MEWLLVIFGLAGVCACIPLVVLRPQVVFYIFLFFAVFSKVFAGYFAMVGNLGIPKSWGPVDVIFFLLLAAIPFVPRSQQSQTSIIKVCLIILSFISFVSLAQGLVMYPELAARHSRVVHFAAAGLFGLRYFTDYRRVEGFMRFCIVLLLIQFGVHVLIRFGIFTPPSAETVYETQLGGERGGQSLAVVLYFVLLSIGIGRLVGKSGSMLVSTIWVLVAMAGILLNEARSSMAVAGLVLMVSLVFLKGRHRMLLAYCVAGGLAVYAAGSIGFDFLQRFYERGGKMIDVTDLARADSYRMGEYRFITSSYHNEPVFILTGRGIGASHYVPSRRANYYAAYYHSEYLGWLDRCGLLGLAAYGVMLTTVVLRAFAARKQNDPHLKSYASATLILAITMTVDGIFHPMLSHHSGAPVLVCFMAIFANWRSLQQSVYEAFGGVELQEAVWSMGCMPAGISYTMR